MSLKFVKQWPGGKFKIKSKKSQREKWLKSDIFYFVPQKSFIIFVHSVNPSYVLFLLLFSWIIFEEAWIAYSKFLRSKGNTYFWLSDFSRAWSVCEKLVRLLETLDWNGLILTWVALTKSIHFSFYKKL